VKAVRPEINQQQNEESLMWRSTVGCIVTLTLSILAMVLAATAQPAGKVPRIGWLTTGVRPAEPHPLLEAFRQGLRDLGYVEGRNMRIESRYAESQEDRCPALAAELVRLPVDVLVAAGTAPIQAAQHATSTIPIVMAWGTDPVAQGFVASLARPGGNITGLSAMRHDLLGKQLELLTQMVPTASRIAVLTNPANPANVLQMREVQRAAQVVGVQLHVLEARSPDDLERVFAALPREGVHALLLNWARTDAVALALQSRLAAMYNGRRDVEAGGLMSYGPSQPDMHYRAAYYVDRLLKGTPPADLPVEQPRKFELVLNLKTAQALGLTMPPTHLILADEVIK
jgi:putative tryptophan/tyrosine transport system substrate-binding protein